VFTFDATPVKFVGLLLLFAWCTAWSLYEVTRHQGRRHRISHGLHLGMAVVMLLMVARPTWSALTAVLPTPAWVAVFGLATLWFGWLTVDAARASDRAGRLHFAGHTLMFAAMTWHLAAMAAKMATMAAGAGSSPQQGTMAAGMGGHGMAGRADGDVLWWFALAGLPLMAYLLVAAVGALRRALAPAPARAHVLVGAGGHSCGDEQPAGTAAARMAAASEFAMNGGMFWMSTGLLTPILPFFALFAF